jgi:hypothetical protein
MADKLPHKKIVHHLKVNNLNVHKQHQLSLEHKNQCLKQLDTKPCRKRRYFHHNRLTTATVVTHRAAMRRVVSKIEAQQTLVVSIELVAEDAKIS